MKAILVTTTTCSKCPEISAWVAQNMPNASVFDETMPGFGDALSDYSVTTAPTLILLDDHDEEIFRGNEVSEVEDFLKIHNTTK